MDVESAEVELAYTYAWWLTGDARAARTAVLAAVDRPDVPGADADLRLEILLRRVRAAAVQQPTMCPASELALLHDAIGLGLDSAAGLAMIDAREARTELAHGRLEALGPDVEVEVVEPHRLGGLAVGNPADVAAARQNPKLGQLRANILRGRDELVGVSRVPVPRELLDAVEARRRGRDGGIEAEPVEAEWFARRPDPPDVRPAAPDLPAEEAPAADPEVEDPSPADRPSADRVAAASPPAADLEPAEEIDLTRSAPATGSRGQAAATPSRRGFAILAVVAVLAVLGVLAIPVLGGQADDEPTPTPAGSGPDATDPAAPEPVATDPAATDPAATDPAAPGPDATDPAATDPAATDAGPPAAEPAVAFAVSEVGVAVGIGGEPGDDNPTAGPFDPVSISVAYTGAEAGDALVADWTVEGEPYDEERADLSPLLTESRFSKPVPEEGWPVGQHVLSLVLERTGEVVGEARFRVDG